MTDLGYNLGYDLGASVGYDIKPDFLDLITFANASPRIAINPVTGVVTEFPANVPAITTIYGKRYVQVEAVRECLVTQNQDLTHADWTKPTSADSLSLVIDPLGGNTAYRFVPSVASASHWIYQANTYRTLAICAKAAGYNYAYIRYNVAGTDVGCVICDLTTGVITEVIMAGVTRLSWARSQRLAWGGVYFEATLSANGIYAGYGVTNVNNALVITGDGSSGADLWLPQANTSTKYCGSLIRTVAAAVTRAKDEPIILAASVPTAIKDKVTVSAYPEWADTQLVAGDERTLIEYADTTQNIRCYYDGADKKVKVAGRIVSINQTNKYYRGVCVYNGVIYAANGTDGSIDSWSTNGGLRNVLVTDCTTNVYGVAVDGTYIYYSITSGASTGIYRAAIGGGTSSLLTNSVSGPLLMSCDATKIFWADNGSGKIKSYLLADGTVTDEKTGLTSPVKADCDATNLYWSDSSTGKISYQPLGGGATVDLIAGLASPQGITLDGSVIFYALNGGTVYSASLATGFTIATIATGQTTARGIGHCGTKIYIAANGLQKINAIFKAPFSSAATTHSANQQLTVSLDRVAGTLTLAGFMTGNGVTTETAWNRTDGNLYLCDSVLGTQFDTNAVRIE